jgi:uncharacterized protein YbcI
VRLLREYTGRGPTKARTHFNDNLITVVVQNLLTKDERSLVRDGKADLVLDTRRAYQQTRGPHRRHRGDHRTPRDRLSQRQPH